MPESPPLAIPLRAEFAPAEMPSPPSSDDPRDRHGHRPLSGARISDPNYSGKSPQLRVGRTLQLWLGAAESRAERTAIYSSTAGVARVGKRHDILSARHILSRASSGLAVGQPEARSRRACSARNVSNEHARSLAVAQTVTARPTKGHPLSRRLTDNGAVLLHAYRMITKSIDTGHAITAAAEWLVDNYYLVEREIREIRAALPPGYYRQLARSWLKVPFHGIARGCSAWLGPSSHTPTAISIPSCYAAAGARLPGGAASDYRRTLGGCHHAPDRAGRNLLTPRRTDHATAVLLAGRRGERTSPIGCWGAGRHPAEPASIVVAEREGTTP